VVKYNREKLPSSPASPSPAPSSPAAPPSPEAKNYIGAEKAKSLALAHAGVSNARDIECDFDVEKGISVYEVDFESGNTEYEYVINALSGEIISSNKEIDD